MKPNIGSCVSTRIKDQVENPNQKITQRRHLYKC